MMSRRNLMAAVILVLTASAAPTSAYPKVTLPPAKDGRLDNLVPVPAPDARAVALNETLGLLAYCHDRSYENGQVSLVRLDAKGNPPPYATTWKLPKPAAMAKLPTLATAAAFHPKLPLLYVWQDVVFSYNVAVPPALPPEMKEFDHLFIYNVAKDPPELVAGLCRGTEVMFGLYGGGLAVDPTGSYLYVPNFREAKTPSFMHAGRYTLDAEGLPELTGADAKLPTAARIKRLTELNAPNGFLPPVFTPLEYQHTFPASFHGAGHCFLPLSKDVLMVGGANGLINWRPADKDCTLSGLPFRPAGYVQATLHPTLPFVYATANGTDSAFRVGHSEGFLTGLPLQIVFPGTRLTSAPAALSKSKKLAVGGFYHVYLVGLDDEGRPTGEATRVRVLNPQVRAIIYSERFDRLYVGVEESK
jgi:hypothetical protein